MRNITSIFSHNHVQDQEVVMAAIQVASLILTNAIRYDRIGIEEVMRQCIQSVVRCSSASRPAERSVESESIR